MKIPDTARFWSISFTLWCVLLFILSELPANPEPGVEIPHLDKFAHFGYFFGGAGLLSAALFCRKNQSIHWTKLISIVVISLFVIGVLDEFHQSYTAGRQGNDIFDLLADTTGAFIGCLVFRSSHKLLGRSLLTKSA